MYVCMYDTQANLWWCSQDLETQAQIKYKNQPHIALSQCEVSYLFLLFPYGSTLYEQVFKNKSKVITIRVMLMRGCKFGSVNRNRSMFTS